MLKDLVRKRLNAAADEIFGLFETAIASYDEQLCRAREETERHRQQMEAVCKAQIVIRIEDVQRLIAHHAHHTQLHKHPQHTQKEEEASVIMLPLAGDSVQECKEEPAELPHHSPSGDQRGQPAPKDLQAPLAQSDDREEKAALRSNVDREGVQLGLELLPEPHGESSILGQKDPQSIYVKEEEVEVGTFPLTVVSVDNQDKPPEWSQLHHDSSSRDHFGGPPPDGLFAPLSDIDDMEEHLRSDTDCEGDNKQLKCSEKEKTGNEIMTQMWKKGFPCSVCGKIWTKKSKLREHMRTHTGEKPYRCSVCGKKLSRKDHLVTHMRTHTGEKPFSCSTCGRKFSQNKGLVRHMRTHTGEKPFSCSVCGKKFSRKEYLAMHMSTHIDEKPF
ncbi:uncharacterized protein LOC144042965 isoform X2 [Vanacampus margaritifer]